VDDAEDTLPPEEALASASGWFGKLSFLGDFASRRLPEPFVARCDAWLSSGVATSRSSLGERWLDVYLTAPLWRFALGPGLAGDDWWLGVLMPSVDRVGRYFPLLVCETASSPPTSRDELEAAGRWFDHVSAAALSTLRPAATLDAFEASLTTAPRWSGATGSLAPPPARSPGHERYRAPRCLSLAEWIATIGAARLRDGLHGHSLWWAPSRDGDDTFSIAPGWPPAERFADLLEGRW